MPLGQRPCRGGSGPFPAPASPARTRSEGTQRHASRAGGAAGRRHGAAVHAARPWRSEDDPLWPQPALAERPAAAPLRARPTHRPAPRDRAGARRSSRAVGRGGRSRGGATSLRLESASRTGGASLRSRLRPTCQLLADPRSLSAEPRGVHPPAGDLRRLWRGPSRDARRGQRHPQGEPRFCAQQGASVRALLSSWPASPPFFSWPAVGISSSLAFGSCPPPFSGWLCGAGMSPHFPGDWTCSHTAVPWGPGL